MGPWFCPMAAVGAFGARHLICFFLQGGGKFEWLPHPKPWMVAHPFQLPPPQMGMRWKTNGKGWKIQLRASTAQNQENGVLAPMPHLGMFGFGCPLWAKAAANAPRTALGPTTPRGQQATVWARQPPKVGKKTPKCQLWQKSANFKAKAKRVC